MFQIRQFLNKKKMQKLKTVVSLTVYKKQQLSNYQRKYNNKNRTKCLDCHQQNCITMTDVNNFKNVVTSTSS